MYHTYGSKNPYKLCDTKWKFVLFLIITHIEYILKLVMYVVSNIYTNIVILVRIKYACTQCNAQSIFVKFEVWKSVTVNVS
jgi:hypothetical protein